MDLVAALGGLLVAPGGEGAEDQQRGEAAGSHAVPRERKGLGACRIERHIDALGEVAQFPGDWRDLHAAAFGCHDALQAAKVFLQVLEDGALVDDLLVDFRERILHRGDLGVAEAQVFRQSAPEGARLAKVFVEIALCVNVVQGQRVHVRRCYRAVVHRRGRPVGKGFPLLHEAPLKDVLAACLIPFQ